MCDVGRALLSENVCNGLKAISNNLVQGTSEPLSENINKHVQQKHSAKPERTFHVPCAIFFGHVFSFTRWD